jgi:hypothetical protein
VPIVVWWLFFVVVIGAWARNRGRSFLIWAVLALIFSPILAAIVLLVLLARQRGAIARLTSTLDDWSDALSRKSREIRERRNEAAELKAEAEAEKRREMVDQIISACAADASRKSPSPAGPTSPQDFQPAFARRAVEAR